MGFSFSADRGRQANQDHPQVRAMRALADRYGVHTGSASDSETFERMFVRFMQLVPGPLPSDLAATSALASKESANTSFPLAAYAAWSAAALLPNSTVVKLNDVLGRQGLVTGATLFSDAFPGLVKAPVLGKRVKMWRSPAAIAVAMMGA